MAHDPRSHQEQFKVWEKARAASSRLWRQYVASAEEVAAEGKKLDEYRQCPKCNGRFMRGAHD